MRWGARLWRHWRGWDPRQRDIGAPLPTGQAMAFELGYRAGRSGMRHTPAHPERYSRAEALCWLIGWDVGGRTLKSH